MNSSATESTISLSRLLTRRIIPIIITATILAILTSNTGTYFSLKELIPPERHAEARQLAFFGNWLTAASYAALLLVFAYVYAIIQRHILRPAARLAAWAEEMCRRGEGPRIRAFTRVEEIRTFVAAFMNLIGKQATNVEQIGRLVGATRHNLRVHLAHISSFAQFVLDGKREALEAARNTLSEVRNVTHIIDINADIAKNYSHILGAPPTEIEVADLVHDTLDELEIAAAEKDVSLTTEFPPSSLVAIAHRNKLEDVIHNLVDNAIKYTPQGGNIRLSVSSRPDPKASAPSQLVIEVADTGIGIPDEEKPHVFEHQFRGRLALAEPGDGYGLNHVASTVALYGGSIDVRDNAPQGTVITIRLNVLPSSLPTSVCSAPCGQPHGLALRTHPSYLPRLCPRTNSGWFYALLTTIPMAGIFAALLFYEWFGNTPVLADATYVSSIYIAVLDAFIIGYKVIRLRILMNRPRFANSRLRIVARTFAINIDIIAAYFLQRFYGWLIAIVGALVLAVILALLGVLLRLIFRLACRYLARRRANQNT